jgi:hypothetical protein
MRTRKGGCYENLDDAADSVPNAHTPNPSGDRKPNLPQRCSGSASLPRGSRQSSRDMARPSLVCGGARSQREISSVRSHLVPAHDQDTCLESCSVNRTVLPLSFAPHSVTTTCRSWSVAAATSCARWKTGDSAASASRGWECTAKVPEQRRPSAERLDRGNQTLRNSGRVGSRLSPRGGEQGRTEHPMPIFAA